MLSGCIPFSRVYELACKKLGVPIRVFCHIHGSSGELGDVIFLGNDQHRMILATGVMKIKTAKNIHELVAAFHEEIGEAITRVHIKLVAGTVWYEASVSCTPINPELIAAAVTRLLIKAIRSSNG